MIEMECSIQEAIQRKLPKYKRLKPVLNSVCSRLGRKETDPCFSYVLEGNRSYFVCDGVRMDLQEPNTKNARAAFVQRIRESAAGGNLLPEDAEIQAIYLEKCTEPGFFTGKDGLDPELFPDCIRGLTVSHEGRTYTIKPELDLEMKEFLKVTVPKLRVDPAGGVLSLIREFRKKTYFSFADAFRKALEEYIVGLFAEAGISEKSLGHVQGFLAYSDDLFHEVCAQDIQAKTSAGTQLRFTYRKHSFTYDWKTKEFSTSLSMEAWKDRYRNLCHAMKIREDFLQRWEEEGLHGSLEVKILKYDPDIQLSYQVHSKSGKKVHFQYKESFPVHGTYVRKNQNVLREYKKFWEDREKEKQEKEKAKEKERECKVKELSTDTDFYGNPLCMDLIRIVQENERHITKTVLIAAMRGTAMSRTTSYQKTGVEGRYSFFSAGEIEDTLRLLCREGHLYTLKRSNDYLDYFIYRVSEPEVMALLQKAKATNYPKTKPNAEKYTYADWSALLLAEHADAGQLTAKDWARRLPLLDKPELYCRYQEEYLRFFRQAPEEIRMYIQIRAKSGEKFCRLLEKELKKEKAE